MVSCVLKWQKQPSANSYCGDMSLHGILTFCHCLKNLQKQALSHKQYIWELKFLCFCYFGVNLYILVPDACLQRIYQTATIEDIVFISSFHLDNAILKKRIIIIKKEFIFKQCNCILTCIPSPIFLSVISIVLFGQGEITVMYLYSKGDNSYRQKYTQGEGIQQLRFYLVTTEDVYGNLKRYFIDCCCFNAIPSYCYEFYPVKIVCY